MTVHTAIREERPLSGLDVIYQRRSVRDYLPDELAPHRVRELIAAAAQAPSPMNHQDWTFIVVRDRAVLKKCSDLAKAFLLSKIDEAVSPLAGFRRGLADPDFNIFYNAPALVVICAYGRDEMARQACCLAAENLMLAASAQGLGSCWIGLAEDWLNEPQAKDFLGISAALNPVAPIIIGRPKTVPSSPGRRIPEVNWVASRAV